MKKYKLTNNTKKVNGRKLYQIQALRDFGNVKKGDLGGWIESEDNLPHDGDCWIYDNGMVFEGGWVSNSVKILGNGQVFEKGRVYGNSVVSGNGMVFGNSVVYGNVKTSGNTKITGYSNISGNIDLSDDHTYHNIAISDKYHIQAKFEVGDKILVDGKIDIIKDMYLSDDIMWIYMCDENYYESELIKLEPEVEELFSI